MSLPVAIMFGVAGVFTLIGMWMFARLRSPAISANQTYAFRMVGTMLVSGGIVLAMSAMLMWQWSAGG